MDFDSENGYVSQLPRAKGNTRLPSPSKHFGELSASSVNARNAEMPPPPIQGEKRKTLAERGGEPYRARPAPMSRTANTDNKATSVYGSYRQPSLSSSIASSRPSSVASSRNISNGSFASTMSTASRPPSAQGHRPQSAMAGSRLQRPQSVQGRPISSLEAHQPGHTTGRGHGKRNGRTPFSSNFLDCSETQEQNEYEMSHDTHTQSISEWASSDSPTKSTRSISLSTAMNNLSIRGIKPEATPIFQKRGASSTTSTGSKPLPKQRSLALSTAEPTTPSHIPKLISYAVDTAPTSSPPKSPKKTPAPKSQFLNRFTNTTLGEVGEGFVIDDRLQNVENLIYEFKGKFDGATTESETMKEIVALYKGRGLHPSSE
ncbi:MAG: hypothetical protein Q9222_005627 [Ikaeria aurantiellina]